MWLVEGKDFLRERGTQSAVSMELSTTEGQLCISINTHTVRLSPTTLEDFHLPPLVLRRFCSDPDSVLDPSSTGGTVWCHVLPSMKKGQIITISRQLPRDGPFRTYTDLQNHWNSLYGYRLPELPEAERVYCSVYFRLLGETLFTYPLSCIRLQPAQCCPRGDLQGALGSFLSDVRDRVHSVCGFPARLTRKPCYHTTSLNSAASAQVQSGEQVNLTTSSSSVRPALTQLPPPPPRPVGPSFRSQPAAWPPRSQQDRALGLLGNGRGVRSSLTQSQERRGDGDSLSSLFSCSDVAPPLFSTSSSSSPPLFQQAPPLFSTSSSSSPPLFQPAPPLSSSSSPPLFQPAPPLFSTSSLSSPPLFQPAPPLSSSSSPPLFQSAPPLSSSSSSSSIKLFQPGSFLTPPSLFSSTSRLLFQPASSLSSSSSWSTSSSSVPPPLPPPISPAPKLVPIFMNKHPSRHLHVAQLRAQKQREQLGGGGEERRRLTLPAFRRNTPASAPPPFFPSLPVPPPPTVPRFIWRPEPTGSTAPPASAPPTIRHLSSLSPGPRSRPGLVLAPHTETQNKPKSGSGTHLVAGAENSRQQQEEATQPPEAAEAPPPLTTADKDGEKKSRARVRFEKNPKTSKRGLIQDVDVETLARGNQLFKVNSPTLVLWLKGRGVMVGARLRKEELMLRVMSCLAEA
ncbi:proline-rich protein 36-like isoform X2 [Limanda limanda]|uniref:proline-rich protein 36-like isoform X2 n=1 Tax=Limanda limanda TaxID=27771 RepID=UPI0029C6CC37|nr:proline-rich protein 36-like isoform X2 [Limanda limanda]